MSIKVTETIQTTILDFDTTICVVYYTDYHQYERHRHTIIKQIFQHKKYKEIQSIRHVIDDEIITTTNKEREQ